MMENYKTQKEMVLDYMRRHGSITTKECFEHLGITRLSAAIYLLKQDGYQIAKTGVTKKMPNGRNRYFEIFWIQRKP